MQRLMNFPLFFQPFSALFVVIFFCSPSLLECSASWRRFICRTRISGTEHQSRAGASQGLEITTVATVADVAGTANSRNPGIFYILCTLRATENVTKCFFWALLHSFDEGQRAKWLLPIAPHLLPRGKKYKN